MGIQIFGVQVLPCSASLIVMQKYLNHICIVACGCWTILFKLWIDELSCIYNLLFSYSPCFVTSYESMMDVNLGIPQPSVQSSKEKETSDGSDI